MPTEEKSKELGNVVRITSAFEFETLLPDLLDRLRQNAVTDLMIVYRSKVLDRDVSDYGDDDSYFVKHYWFGTNSYVNLIGLIEYLKTVILDWMTGKPSTANE